MSKTEQMVEFRLPLDQLHALIDQGIKAPLLPKTRMHGSLFPEPGDEQKCEEIEDFFTPEEFEAAEAAAARLAGQMRVDMIPRVTRPQDYNDSFPPRREDCFVFHVPRESIPGIRKCLEIAVASHGPRGWMGRCLLHLEDKFAALEAA
jgi:hypothetical protein